MHAKNVTFRIIEQIQTSPMPSASSERSFHDLKLFHNHLRTATCDMRLDSLLVLFSAKDKKIYFVDKINIREIMNELISNIKQ